MYRAPRGIINDNTPEKNRDCYDTASAPSPRAAARRGDAPTFGELLQDALLLGVEAEVRREADDEVGSDRQLGDLIGNLAGGLVTRVRARLRRGRPLLRSSLAPLRLLLLRSRRLCGGVERRRAKRAARRARAVAVLFGSAGGARVHEVTPRLLVILGLHLALVRRPVAGAVVQLHVAGGAERLRPHPEDLRRWGGEGGGEREMCGWGERPSQGVPLSPRSSVSISRAHIENCIPSFSHTGPHAY